MKVYRQSFGKTAFGLSAVIGFVGIGSIFKRKWY